MKTLLVLAPHPELADAMRAGLNPEQYRVVHRVSAEEAEPMLVHGLADACVLDLELSGVQGVWLIEKLHRRAPRCPLIVYTGSRHADWEEEAYLQGVKHVLNKPFRARLLNTVLDSLFASAISTGTALPARPAETTFLAAAESPRLAPQDYSASGGSGQFQNLKILRDFSAVLSHSLQADALLKQFLLLIREITGVNRAVIFMRPSAASFMSSAPGADNRQLLSACAIGLPADLLANVQLSLESGIGNHVRRLGRVLRRNSPEITDVETQREFELLGAQVAIPVLDRENLVGVALFDARVTGEALANPELELIFHLLEQVGLAIKNIWLHDQVVGNHEMLAEVMRELSSACVVVNRDLVVIHANKTARKFFGSTGARAAELEFSDLPPTLGSKVFQVLKTGSAVTPFRYTPEDAPSSVYQVTIVPIHRSDATVPSSVLLMVEDRTQSEQLQRLEVEAKQLRLVRGMAERLAAEIGNAMVPISVHQQLISERFKDAEFRAALDKALADGVKRVDRLVHQMRYLAGNVATSGDAFPLSSLIEDAYQEARKYQPGKTAKLNNETVGKPILVTGDRAALKHAFSEIILNALQSNPASPAVAIRSREDGAGGALEVKIEVEDNGPGFTAEAQKEATTPFFTTRIPGVGLGLAVTRKIIETHQGKLEIPPPQPGHPGIVRVSLPAGTAEAKR